MTRADWLILALLLAGNGLLYAAYWQSPTPAGIVEIRAPDSEPRRVSLHQDQDLRVAGREGVSTLRIRNGRVRFIDSPCRNRICINSGWHAHHADAAACVPNGISIRLIGDGETIDAVAH